MSLISDLQLYFESFFDHSKSRSSKFVMLLIFLLMIFLVEFVFDFSYNIHVSNKLDHLQKISNLKKGYSNDSIQLNEILSLEEVIINKTHYTFFFSTFFNKISDNHLLRAENKISPLWVYITSNLTLLILVFSSVIIRPFRQKNLYAYKYLKSSIIVGFVAFVLSIIIYYFFYQIPVIFNNPIYNYVLYFVLNIIIFTLFYLSTRWLKNYLNQLAFEKTIKTHTKKL